MVMALGIAWILDGLEITLAADVAEIIAVDGNRSTAVNREHAREND